MKLSMWIVKKALDKYDPVATISVGEQTISGIRLFSQHASLDRDHLYIGRTRDFFGGGTSQEVLLMHRQDVISLRTYDLEDVFNTVTAAFEAYNNWESALFAAAQQKFPEQRIIDACRDVFGPIFLFDTSMNLIAASRNYAPGTVSVSWDALLSTGTFSVYYINYLKETSFLSMVAVPRKRMTFECDLGERYRYGLLISYLNRDKKLIGQMVLCSDQPMEQYEMQLSAVVEQALNAIAQPQVHSPADSVMQGMLAGMLREQKAGPEAVAKLLACQGWKQDDRFCIACLEGQKPQDAFALPSLMERASRMFGGDCVFAQADDQLIGCLRVESEKECLAKLDEFTAQTGFVCGVSYTFSNLDRMPEQCRQAKAALRCARERKARLSPFRRCALPELMRAFDSRSYQASCVHPALAVLRECDEANATEYRHTLRVFLQCERRYTNAAQALRVHRNTLIYRVGRILELVELDLDDPEEREYLLISYRILDEGFSH